MPAITRIVCATDFSDTARKACEYAVFLGGRMGAELIIVHAYQLPVTMEMPAEVAAVIAKQVQEELDGFIKGIDTQGLKVSSSLCEGVPYVEIVRVAQDTGADLVVIGTHGRTGLAHLLLGSVAERVVRTSTAPVLVIR